jgi:hypothetical protein
MTTALILLWAVLGGMWRRVFGGWTGLPRSICYGLMAPLTLPIWLSYPWGPYWPYCLLAGVCLTVACLLFFVVSLAPGPSFTNARCFLKYGPFGAGYWLARLYWTPTWLVGGFIDGPMAVGEIFLGASFWGCVGLLWLWVA